MTFAIFIIVFLALFLAVLNVLPVASPLPTAFVTSVDSIVGYMMSWNFLIPIQELLFCVGIIIGVEVSIWFWKAFKWLLHIIRGNSN